VSGTGYDPGGIAGPPGPAGDLVGLENVVDLRAELPGNPNAIVVLMGYTDPENADQGLFQWDAGAATDDGVTRFNAGGLGSFGSGWQRVYSGVVNVRWAGAIGDGVTDDSAAIQRAIDVATLLDGIKVYFPRGDYFCSSVLTVHNNTYFLGDGQAAVSGFTVPATKIIDGRNNPATPFLSLLGNDVDGNPTSRGCMFEDIYFEFPSSGKTDYSILIDSTTATRFSNCFFKSALDADPLTDPGVIRLTAFEGVVFEYCTFWGGSVVLSFEGTGAGGPFTARNCWFYDCEAEWIKCDSNGDHDYSFELCAFDPLARTTRPAAGIILMCNGFSIKNCSFFGNGPQQPTGSYLVVTGVGIIEGCNGVLTGNAAARPIWLTLDGASITVQNNRIVAYCCINAPGGGSHLITRANKFTALQVPDNPGELPQFQVKRAVIINYTVQGAIVVDLEDSFESVYGTILNVTDATFATPIVVEIDVANGWEDNDTVQVFGVGGNTAANGYWVVNKIDATHYELIGSVGNAAFTTDGQGRQYWHFTNSYYVGGDDGGPSYTFFTSGVIHWARNADQSGYSNTNTAEGARGLFISGNVHVGGVVRLDVLDPIMVPKGTGQTMYHSDASGNLITNEGFVSDVSYLLPPIECGLRYDFEKRPDVITAGNPAVVMTITTTPTTVAIVDVSNTTPIVVNTGTINHPFGTGDIVTITGNAAANGTWTVTRVDSTHFSLDTSVAGGVVAGGTAARDSYIMLEGIKDGTLSIANSDLTQYGARISLEARFRYNTSTGLDELRWYVIESLGDWLDAGAA